MTSGSTHMFWWEDPSNSHTRLSTQLSMHVTWVCWSPCKLNLPSVPNLGVFVASSFRGGSFFFVIEKWCPNLQENPWKIGCQTTISTGSWSIYTPGFFWWDTKPQTNALISTQKIHSKITIDDPLFFTAFEFERGAEITSAPLGFITLSSPRIFWCQACEAAAKACLKPQANEWYNGGDFLVRRI